MSIDELDFSEQELMLKVHSAEGTIEEKSDYLRRNGVFDSYNEICKAYAKMIGSQENGIEALKRAIFLCWYQFAEPSCFTGIHKLSEEITKQICESLEYKVFSNDLDFELQWMLSHYNKVIDLPFSLYPNLEQTKLFLAKSNFSWQEIKPDKKMFEKRGQMGFYWRTIL